LPPKPKIELSLTESGTHRDGYTHTCGTTIHHEDSAQVCLEGQKHKITKTLPYSSMVVNLTILIHMKYVVDDPIKDTPTRHVFRSKHENTLCRKTAESFLNRTHTTFEYALLRNLSPTINSIGSLSKKLKNVNLTHSTDRARCGSFNLTTNYVLSYVLDNRNINTAFETYLFRFEYFETKNFSFLHTFRANSKEFPNSDSVVVLAVVIDILFNKKIKVITNFQRIGKRIFGAIS
jgi:hypothetical protein